MNVGDLVKHRGIGLVGVLTKLDGKRTNSRIHGATWIVHLQNGGRLVKWFSANVEVINGK
jgi:hypothetical protein